LFRIWGDADEVAGNAQESREPFGDGLVIGETTTWLATNFDSTGEGRRWDIRQGDMKVIHPWTLHHQLLSVQMNLWLDHTHLGGDFHP